MHKTSKFVLILEQNMFLASGGKLHDASIKYFRYLFGLLRLSLIGAAGQYLCDHAIGGRRHSRRARALESRPSAAAAAGTGSAEMTVNNIGMKNSELIRHVT